MVLSINQQIFDDTVKENIQEFGMSTEEAIEDTVKQFESQGVDLSNIIKDLMLEKTDDILVNALSALSVLAKSKTLEAPEKYTNLLLIIKTQCDKGLTHKVLAGKHGAYGIIVDIMVKKILVEEVISNCLKTLISLMTSQPDLLDDLGLKTFIDYLEEHENPEIKMLVFKLLKECCIKHELNRQHIFEILKLENVKKWLDQTNTELICEVLAVLRALVLDDDVRVEFGRAHEHARAIASITLSHITGLILKFKTEENLINSAIMTISALLVRTEFCKDVEDADGLNAIKDIMITYQACDKLIRQCFKVLKALAGNDEVKVHIIQKGLAPLIAASLNTHKNSVTTSTSGLACVAALALRNPDNSKALFEAGTPEVIVECMQLNPEDANVQKNGSWAIRNMVSRSRYQSEKFLSLGVEEILQKNLTKFPRHEYDTKSALRDLGCDVKLKEEWTGKGGMLTTQSQIKN